MTTREEDRRRDFRWMTAAIVLASIPGGSLSPDSPATALVIADRLIALLEASEKNAAPSEGKSSPTA
jgi:hypothetical protein